VRVNALQAYFDLTDQGLGLETGYTSFIQELEKEKIPSLSAGIGKIKNRYLPKGIDGAS
jgi:hypothetical protein